MKERKGGKEAKQTREERKYKWYEWSRVDKEKERKKKKKEKKEKEKEKGECNAILLSSPMASNSPWSRNSASRTFLFETASISRDQQSVVRLLVRYGEKQSQWGRAC
jgi:hypothetical protein